MSRYKIKNKNETYKVEEAGGLCINASSSIDWCIKLPFEHLRNHCERKGWIIIPVVDKSHSFITFHGVEYELIWNGERLSTILQDGEEISWKELPEQLKGLCNALS